MEISIRKYKPGDMVAAMHLLEGLKDFITSVDLWGIEDRKPGYASEALKEIMKKREVVFLAETKDGKIVGMATVSVLKKDKLGKMVTRSGTKSGEVSTLYVDAKYRRNNVGSRLMAASESYLKKRGCTHVEVGMFWPNKDAHKFYKGKKYGLYNAIYIKKV